MEIITTKFSGVYLLKFEKKQDDRGFFKRTFCQDLFKEKELHLNFKQTSFCYNKKKGTVRGLHYQKYPFEEIKIVECLKGEIFDVVVDYRKESDTFGEYGSFRLSDDNDCSLYIPAGFAHGYQTLQDDTILYYHISENFIPEYAGGYHIQSKSIQINWPMEITKLSLKDEQLPEFVK